MSKKGRRRGKKVLKKNPQKYSNGQDIPRSDVIRVENSWITDWGGRFLDPEIRNHFAAGNTVRIALGPQGTGELYQTMYFKITEIIGRDRHGLRFRGVCDDPYYGEWSEFFANNGHQRVFSAKSEVPLEWEGNSNLKKVAQFKNYRRVCTGA
jgi:hypothetical protein